MYMCVCVWKRKKGGEADRQTEEGESVRHKGRETELERQTDRQTQTDRGRERGERERERGER